MQAQGQSYGHDASMPPFYIGFPFLATIPSTSQRLSKVEESLCFYSRPKRDPFAPLRVTWPAWFCKTNFCEALSTSQRPWQAEDVSKRSQQQPSSAVLPAILRQATPNCLSRQRFSNAARAILKPDASYMNSYMNSYMKSYRKKLNNKRKATQPKHKELA